MSIDLILGTAGHIDHGKTSLTRALTGTDTDRLPEEKKRGITIELGYAHLDLPPYRLGIVDVPGHERFVRQMLAGATGMDLAMLVVAGDDSVKQQTREHLDILRLLNLPSGVIAITKCDLSDDDWLDLVEEEIRGVVAGTFLENAEIIRTSAKTGQGIDELKAALKKAAEVAAESERQQRIHAPFRMAIDRTFTIDGHGTVVTGSVSSGRANVGDQIQVQPGNKTVRIRGLQSHDESADQVHRGQRAAINLAGIHHLEIDRGHELCAEGHLLPSQLMTVELRILSTLNKPFKDRTRVRFHVGTAELLGNVRLLQSSEIAPGESGFAQIFLNEPAVAIWNQPFVIRRQSPVETIGGGRVLHPNANRIRKPTELDLEMIRKLAGSDPKERASASLFLSDDPNWSPESLPRTAGVVHPEDVYHQLLAEDKLLEVKLSVTRNAIVHRQRFELLAERVIKVLRRLHEQHPLKFSHPRQSLDAEFLYLNQPELLKAVVTELKNQKKLMLRNETVSLVGFGPKLSKGETQLISELVQTVKDYGLQPLTPKELQLTARKNRDSVPQLLNLACENGDLAKVGDGMYFHQDVLTETKSRIADEIQKNGGLTMSQIRQLLDISRKYAVPLCEYFDAIGFTEREGDKRVLATRQDSSKIDE